MYFAELNIDGICIAVTQPKEPLVGARFVPLAFMDLSALGMRRVGNSWVVVPE